MTPGPQPHNQIGTLADQWAKTLESRPASEVTESWAAADWLVQRRLGGLDGVLGRLRRRLARQLLLEWAGVGVWVRLNGERLYAGPSTKVTSEMRGMMLEYRTELLEACRGEEAERRTANDGAGGTADRKIA